LPDSELNFAWQKPMDTYNLDSKRIANVFERAFGTTSKETRLKDIAAQAASLGRSSDPAVLQAETGELLCHILKFCNDRGWNAQTLVNQTLDKLESQSNIEQSVSDVRPVSARRVAIYARLFDPPTRSHRQDVIRLLESGFDEVVLCALGPRVANGEHQHTSPLHRAALVTLGFRGLDRVTVDYGDISQSRYSTTSELAARHQSRGRLWHVRDAESLRSDENSKERDEVDLSLDVNSSAHQWLLFHPVGQPPEAKDISPKTLLLSREQNQTSEQVRQLVYASKPISDCVVPLVESYIERHKLFVPYSSQRFASFRTSQPRMLVVADTRNPKSVAAMARFEKYQSDDPEMILVLGGDGTMLHAIREHWRLRVPFVGVNTGHLGFLMNERLPDSLASLELNSYTLPMLRVDTERPDGDQAWGLAFSDVWVERAEGQAAWLRLDVDGETRVSKVVGDGMLVATASGSSAYARAMGAVPVPLNTPTVTLVGSNIFQPRFWKPMTLPDESVVTLTSLDRSGKRPVRCFIDGTPMGVVQQLTIKRSLTASVELAFTKEFDPSARLLRSLFPPDEM
jgi:NAD+ kinase